MDAQGAPTVATVIAQATEVLAAAGCADPAADAEAITADALGVAPAQLAANGTLHVPADVGELIDRHVKRRRKREPLEYILGRCQFRQLELLVDPRVLVPQPETTGLVDIALRQPQHARVHDVGTGSGAVALATKYERPDLIVSGSDISREAIQVARMNARRLALDVVFTAEPGLPPGHYDLVLANLPYQDEAGQTNADPPEITDYQPSVAIYGGEDGLDHIRALLRTMPAGLTVALQHAATQAPAVAALLVDPEPFGDLTAPHRFTVGHVP
jgi:release factor glutamine methyltransferase